MFRYRVVMEKGGHVYAVSIIGKTAKEVKRFAVDLNPGAFVLSMGAIERV